MLRQRKLLKFILKLFISSHLSNRSLITSKKTVLPAILSGKLMSVGKLLSQNIFLSIWSNLTPIFMPIRNNFGFTICAAFIVFLSRSWCLNKYLLLSGSTLKMFVTNSLTWYLWNNKKNQRLAQNICITQGLCFYYVFRVIYALLVHIVPTNAIIPHILQVKFIGNVQRN